MEPILVKEGIRVPAEALAFKAVRAGGPGGQNVNKVASKVELRVDLRAIEGLHPAALLRLQARLRNRLDADGWWVLVVARTRDQVRNLEEARAKVQEAVLECLEAPTPRRPTRPTKASQTRRLEAKRHAAKRRQDRRGGGDD